MEKRPTSASERRAWFVSKAEFAQRQAELTADPQTKAIWQQIADSWRDLATIKDGLPF
jgi:hypothetical protein